MGVRGDQAGRHRRRYAFSDVSNAPTICRQERAIKQFSKLPKTQK